MKKYFASALLSLAVSNSFAETWVSGGEYFSTLHFGHIYAIRPENLFVEDDDIPVALILSNSDIGYSNKHTSGRIAGVASDEDADYGFMLVEWIDVKDIELHGGISGIGSVRDNTIMFVDGQTTGDLYGGRAFGGDPVSAIRNYTFIYGGEINANIYGAYAYHGIVADNVVYLSGGKIVGNVYAGDINVGHVYNNTIILDANLSEMNTKVDLSEAKLYGANIRYPEYGDSGMSNNSLEVYAFDFEVAKLGFFDNYYFVLPKTISDGDVVLSVGSTVSLDGTNIGVAMASGEYNLLQKGDTVVLIDNAKGDFGVADMSKVNLKGTQGISLVYDFDIRFSGKQLEATVVDKSVAEESKAPSEGVAASVAVLTAGADIVAGAALENALSVAATSGVGNFGSISGGSYNYKTGSDVDVLGLSGVAGIAKAFDVDFGKAMAGFFVEAGYGKHETHNDFSFGSITGKGNSTYSGVGLLGYAEFEKMKGVYAEASMRLGMINSDWSSDDLGMDVSYSTGSMYYGLHLGAGYKNQLNDNLGYDLYAKYFIAHQNSNDVTISGDKFGFDAVNSHRVRLGSKLSLTSFEQINPYLGVAWEHEFDGEARATVYGLDVPAPTLAGDTGIIELGIKNKQAQNSALTFEFGLQGYFGMRTGIGGILQGVYKF